MHRNLCSLFDQRRPNLAMKRSSLSIIQIHFMKEIKNKNTEIQCKGSFKVTMRYASGLNRAPTAP